MVFCWSADQASEHESGGSKGNGNASGWGFVVRPVPWNPFALLGVEPWSAKPHCRTVPRRKRTEGGDRTRAAAKPSPTPIEVVLARTHRPATKRRQGVDEVNCSASLAWPLLSLRGEN